MQKFIIKVIIFILPILVTFTYWEYNLGKIENSYSYKLKQIEKMIDEIEVINFGSSHGLYGINPEYFDYKGFNLANTSQSLYYDYRFAQRYITKAKNLKVVIIPISYFSMGYNMNDSLEPWRQVFYLRFYDFPMEGSNNINLIMKYQLIKAYGIQNSISYLLKGFKVNNAKEITPHGCFMENGYKTDNNSDELNAAKGKERAAYHTGVYKRKYIEANRQYIEEIIQLCLSRNIEPVIITTPVYKTYSDYMDEDIWNETQEIIYDICDEYHIKYYNYLKDDRFKPKDFKNSDHLNPNGAKKLSMIINNEILHKVLQ